MERMAPLTKPDLLMDAVAGFNRNYQKIAQERKPSIVTKEIKNVTPKRNSEITGTINIFFEDKKEGSAHE